MKLPPEFGKIGGKTDAILLEWCYFFPSQKIVLPPDLPNFGGNSGCN